MVSFAFSGNKRLLGDLLYKEKYPSSFDKAGVFYFPFVTLYVPAEKVLTTATSLNSNHIGDDGLCSEFTVFAQVLLSSKYLLKIMVMDQSLHRLPLGRPN